MSDLNHATTAPDASTSIDASTPSDASTSIDAGASMSYPETILADHPSIYLRFGETSGSTMARDEIGTTNGAYPSSGVTFGAPGAIVGDTNTAIVFDGSKGIVMPAGGFDFAGNVAFSVEFWANQSSRNMYDFTIDHAVWGADNARGGWDVRLSVAGSGKGLALERWDVTTSGSVVSTTPLPLDAYHYVVATFDGANLTMYVDGAPQGSVNKQNDVPPENMSWMIGAQNCTGCTDNFIGSLDEFALYTRALTQIEITAHYKASGR